MPETTRQTRRKVTYQSLADLEADVDRLAATQVQTVGNWTFPQIVDHLAFSISSSIDGFGFKAPWFARYLIAPFMKNSLLTRSMKPGFQLPKSADKFLPKSDVNLDSAVGHLRTALSRFSSEHPGAEHPFLGKLAAQEWTSLHLRHAELHMSFVVPAARPGSAS